MAQRFPIPISGLATALLQRLALRDESSTRRSRAAAPERKR
jgi:hypothetical protein